MNEGCAIEDDLGERCGRPIDAAKMCSTHRRRKRLELPMTTPIRARRKITIGDLVAAAGEAYEVQVSGASDAEFERSVRRFRRMLKKWADED